jgi:hypothetical protein
MNWNFLIPLGIIIVMSVLGYLMQMLKNATQKQQAERDRERSAARARARDRQPAVRTANRDLEQAGGRTGGVAATDRDPGAEGAAGRGQCCGLQDNQA